MKKAVIFAALAVVAFLSIGVIFGDKDKTSARDVISLCWKEQARKSLSAQEAQFVARTCERMEEDFAKKYGHAP